MIGRWLGIVAACAWMVVARAQPPVTARFEAAPGSPLIGEPVTLTLVVEAPAEAEVTLPQIMTDWPPFEVRAAGEVEKIVNGGRTVYRQSFTVILWMPGDYRTPETFVEYRLPPDSENQRASVEPAFFTAPSVIEPNDLLLRPLKPLEIPPYISPWAILAACGAAAAGGLSLARRLNRRRTRKPSGGPLPDVTGRTLDELRRVRSLALPAAEVYIRAGECLRAYLKDRFGVAAHEMTTDELLAALQSRSALTPRQNRELRRILDQIDLVKFARFRPAPDSTQGLLQRVSRWVVGASPEDSTP
jgi:hypothetical protein